MKHCFPHWEPWHEVHFMYSDLIYIIILVFGLTALSILGPLIKVKKWTPVWSTHVFEKYSLRYVTLYLMDLNLNLSQAQLGYIVCKLISSALLQISITSKNRSSKNCRSQWDVYFCDVRYHFFVLYAFLGNYYDLADHCCLGYFAV